MTVAVPSRNPAAPTPPLDEAGWWRGLGPLAVIAALGWALALAAGTRERTAAVLLAGVTIGAIVVVAAALPWRRWPAAWQVVPALGFLPVAVLLEYAAGDAAEFTFLTGLPIIWAALHFGRRVLAATLALAGLAVFLPPLLLPGAFPDVARGTDALFYSLSLVGGPIAQRLVSQAHAARAQARAATQRADASIERARADRDLLNAYLDNAGCLVIVLAPDSRVLLFNRHAERVLGYRAEDLVGRPAYYQPGDDPESRESFERVIAGDWPQTREVDVSTNSGERRRIVWNRTALTDDAGRVTHVISTGVDITRQRAAERLFANVLAAAAEQIIYATDGRGVFTVFNHGGERLLGYTAEELVGKATVDILHLPEELAAMARAAGMDSFEEVLAASPADMPTVTQEWTLVRKDGSRLPVSMTIDTMTNGDEVVGYVSVARDITAEREAAATMQAALTREREAAERLRQLDRTKTDFVAAVSHDLRTPLTSIVGNTEILLDGDAGELTGPQRRLLDAVDRNARRLRTLVGDLLLLSRIESGTLSINRRPVAMADIIDGAMEAVSTRPAADLELTVDVPSAPVLVEADPDQLERVVINLLSNAVKFTPPGGRVTVALTGEDDHARLRVSDTGIGIPADELPHVFDRFYRSSRSRQDDRPGTGLGLTIAKSIVEQHGGAIRARANPAGGTTFTITLPRLAATAEAPQNRPA